LAFYFPHHLHCSFIARPFLIGSKGNYCCLFFQFTVGLDQVSLVNQRHQRSALIPGGSSRVQAREINGLEDLRITVDLLQHMEVAREKSSKAWVAGLSLNSVSSLQEPYTIPTWVATGGDHVEFNLQEPNIVHPGECSATLS
jgi:hypothetical protein